MVRPLFCQYTRKRNDVFIDVTAQRLWYICTYQKDEKCVGNGIVKIEEGEDNCCVISIHKDGVK